MSEIYLIRHGQAAFGSENYDRLSPVGIHQSRILAGHLFAHDIAFDAVYCGRLQRQKATAQAFCNLYGIHWPALQTPTVLEAFDEYDGRALMAARCRIDREGTVLSAECLKRLRQDERGFQAYFADTLDHWLDGVYDSAPGVETWDHFYRRVAEGIQQIIQRNGRGKRLAVFTSGGPITAVVKMVLGLSRRPAVELGWQLMNASLTIIKYSDGRMALSQFNNTTHLLLERDAALMTYR